MTLCGQRTKIQDVNRSVYFDPILGFDLRNDVAWQSYEASALTEEERELLRDKRFPWSDAYGRLLRRDRPGKRRRPDKDEKELAWRAWCAFVLEIDVDLRPAGRVIMRHPRRAYRVELQYVYDPGTKRYRYSSWQVVADSFMDVDAGPPDIFDLEPYLSALALRFHRGIEATHAFQKIPRRRPESGKPLDPDFYRRLLASYERLVREGRTDPAAELARRMDENRSTVKSWLHRGRKYLEDQSGREKR